jgi:hypothetical protein
MVSNVFLEHLQVNGIFAMAPVKKGQKCTATPAPIGDTFGSVRM